MIILGLLLAAAGAVFGLDLLWKNKWRVPDPVVFGQSLGISSGRWLFVVGGIVGAAITLGVALMLGGVGRRGAKAVAAHKDKKAQHATDRERDALRVENDDLRHRLDKQRVTEVHPASGRGDRAGATSVERSGDDPIVGR